MNSSIHVSTPVQQRKTFGMKSSKMYGSECTKEKQTSFKAFSAEDFREAFRQFPAGVAVVTADSGDGPVAMTVSSLASVGLEPPSVVFSISPLSSSTPTIKESESIVIHLLSKQHVNLGQVCATSNIDRFDSGEQWEKLPTGEPVFDNVAAWMRAVIRKRVDVSGSILIVAEVVQGELLEQNGSPLAYVNREWHALNGTSRL